MAPSRLKARASPIQRVALVLSLLLCTTCGGGGGSSPTEPSLPAPTIDRLQVNWEYHTLDVPVRGTHCLTPGDTVVLVNQLVYVHMCYPADGGAGVPCIVFEDDDGNVVEVIYNPESTRYIAECRTTSEREVQAYYHDPVSHINPGTLGPLVASGCSRAEEFGSWVQCCLADS